MSLSIFPAILIGNSYRKQLFAPFIATKTFGNRPHLYLNSDRLLECSALRFFFYRLLFAFSAFVIVSDQQGEEILVRYKVKRTENIYWFCWNAADELRSWPLKVAKYYTHLKFCFLFSDEAEKCAQLFGVKVRHLRFSVLRGDCPVGKRYLMSYMGEVDIAEDLEDEHRVLDEYLWTLAEKWVLQGQFDFSSELSKLLTEHSDDTTHHRATWILRNRVRYRYAQLLKKAFSDDFVLIGNDWKKLGFNSLPADYDPSSRYRLYSESRLCLDLLSKSSTEAHYPRSGELVSWSNGIMQLNTGDSLDFFGDQFGLRSFSSYPDLKAKMEYFVSLKDQELSELGKHLRDRLFIKTQAHNLRQILVEK